MPPEDVERLRHMLDAAKEAMAFVEGFTAAELETNRQRTLALVKAIEIIGEAAHRISANTKADLPHIPWQVIIGMRHRLVHAYFEIDTEILWYTATANLPPLVAALEKLLGTDP